MYAQVSKLFQNQEDLLSEFGQFLPDCTAQFGEVSHPFCILCQRVCVCAHVHICIRVHACVFHCIMYHMCLCVCM